MKSRGFPPQKKKQHPKNMCHAAMETGPLNVIILQDFKIFVDLILKGLFLFKWLTDK